MAPIDVMLGNKKVVKLPVDLLIQEACKEEEDRHGYYPPLAPGVYFRIKFGELASEIESSIEPDYMPSNSPEVIIPAKDVGKVKAGEIDWVIYPSGTRRKLENVLRSKKYSALIKTFIDTF